ncbi:gamma-glutamyltransferase [Thalassomonas actiniarum]|uniref:Glutathione hydrolase proenzyme n=1 Tax=Thalassomonas actiniarum TaxID=485447 RepID=A0AAF0C5F9_9GAMM|nr:gamma-glutamyltransferase [Thalassomonas actiniarum]WDE01051.1 gamma-glutamyltransferase [Thalassomonas actiniarum]
MSRMITGLCLSTLLFAGTLVAKENTPLKIEDREPEAATGLIAKQAVSAKDFMVAAANPYASEAGFNILKQGGSAVDAAIAVQLVLTLVEPQSSGIGGGAFILHWDKSKELLTTFDGRETAPEKASQEMFLDASGKPVRWIDAVVGGRSVGVPGVLKAFKKAHQQYGKLPWEALFSDAIKLAEEGFVVSPRLEKLVTMQYNPGISKLPEISRYFFPNNQPVKAGTLLKNPKLAAVYRSLAKDGIIPFYQGWIAKKIVDAVQKSPIAPGRLSLSDMKNYQAKQLPAVCGPYHSYKVCGMGPPSSGGISVVQILGQLESFNLSQYQPGGLEAVHLFTQSSRLAFADRDRFLADSAFVDVPVEGLIDRRYLASRAKLIKAGQDMGKALPGDPVGALALADDQAIERPSTSHVSIVDKDGNSISMTTSVEMAFGSAVMVEGFILNNQLTDFSLAPKVNGQWVANRLEPFKRPRSSMAPMMVFNSDGSLKLVVGSPGGSRIINYVAQTILGVLDWQLNPQQAINLPHVTNRNRVTTLEKGTSIAQLKPALEAKGHQVSVRDLNSGIHAIEVKKTGLLGGADPRREGKVLGQ